MARMVNVLMRKYLVKLENSAFYLNDKDYNEYV